MARLFRGASLGHTNGTSSSVSMPPAASSDLPSPFGPLGVTLSDADLRETAYEIFVAACRTTGSKPLTYIPQSERTPPSSTLSSSSSSSATTPSSLQRSLTSTAASKMKKALGLKSSSGKKASPGKESTPSKPARKPATVAELMRLQMGVSEQTDSRIRKGFLRIAAGQVIFCLPRSHHLTFVIPSSCSQPLPHCHCTL